MMTLATVRRVLDAVLTALGVVFGLIPDPTRTPGLVPVEYDRTR